MTSPHPADPGREGPSPTAPAETASPATPGQDGQFERHGVMWWVNDHPFPYLDALAAMEERVAAIHAGTAPETVWLLQHPPLYTAGTSANRQDLLEPERFPVFDAGRGGQFTYHGPGQRIAYVMLNLKTRKPDVRAFVQDMESWITAALARFGVKGETRDGRIGIWVARGTDQQGRVKEDKIAAIGVRLRKWVSFHGLALNVEPELSHFEGIVPCGISADTGGIATGVTSLVDLGHPATLADADLALIDSFAEVFGKR